MLVVRSWIDGVRGRSSELVLRGARVGDVRMPSTIPPSMLLAIAGAVALHGCRTGSDRAAGTAADSGDRPVAAAAPSCATENGGITLPPVSAPRSSPTTSGMPATWWWRRMAWSTPIPGAASTTARTSRPRAGSSSPCGTPGGPGTPIDHPVRRQRADGSHGGTGIGIYGIISMPRSTIASCGTRSARRRRHHGQARDHRLRAADHGRPPDASVHHRCQGQPLHRPRLRQQRLRGQEPDAALSREQALYREADPGRHLEVRREQAGPEVLSRRAICHRDQERGRVCDRHRAAVRERASMGGTSCRRTGPSSIPPRARAAGRGSGGGAQAGGGLRLARVLLRPAAEQAGAGAGVRWRRWQDGGPLRRTGPAWPPSRRTGRRTRCGPTARDSRATRACSSPFTDPGTVPLRRRPATTSPSSRWRRARRGAYVTFADGFAGGSRSRAGPRFVRRAWPRGPTARCTSRTTCTAGSGA